MRDVVESENYGIAYGVYSVPGYNVSAKTGTAQIASDTGDIKQEIQPTCIRLWRWFLLKIQTMSCI